MAPEFTKPLSDATILEGDTVELTCEVNKEGATVKWFADAKEITDDDKFEIITEATVHKLRLKDASLSDAAEITAKVEDQKTTAKLSIEGMSWHDYIQFVRAFEYCFHLFELDFIHNHGYILSK